jgi:hypothetical protein
MTAPFFGAETVRIAWQGIAIAVTYEPNWLNLSGVVGTCAHLTVRAESRCPLPFTETGYQSCFLAPDEIDAAGGPSAYVLAWLDAAAASSHWQASEAAGQQLTLF